MLTQLLITAWSSQHKEKHFCLCVCAYKYKGASYPLSFPRYYCVYLQNMTGHYELSPPSCVLPLPSPLPCERGVGGEQRKDSTVGFPFFSFYQPSEVKMLLAPLCVWARAVHLATESRSGRQQNSLATCVCACVRGGEGEREKKWFQGCAVLPHAEGPPLQKGCTPPAMAATGAGAPHPTGSHPQKAAGVLSISQFLI